MEILTTKSGTTRARLERALKALATIRYSDDLDAEQGIALREAVRALEAIESQLYLAERRS